MTSALEQSLKKRLQLIAKERDSTPAEIWRNAINERFLVRLCQSPYHSHFVLKGGALLARYIDIGRETLDLDFAIQRISSEISILQKVFEDIVEVQIDDGFVFSKPVVTPLEHFHMQYPGARVKTEVHLSAQASSGVRWEATSPRIWIGSDASVIEIVIWFSSFCMLVHSLVRALGCF
ncbi:MAG: hypothetical protein K940chlam2_00316 [Chlamydiae bacterium]|nr:hypothetical protein [Chlamydiota bacterium]